MTIKSSKNSKFHFQVFATTLALATQAAPAEDVFHVDDSVFTRPTGERRYNDLHAITLHYNPDFDHRKFW